MTLSQTWVAIAVIALVTALLRFLPFLIFSGKAKTPRAIERLGALLPSAIMAMLVVYCLKGVSFSSVNGFLPELIASVTVAVSYLIKRNTLISIILGTIVYMLLVQLVF